MELKVFLAGRIVVEGDGVLIDEDRFPGRQGRLLFAYLVAEQGRPVPRDELADALWGETPPATWEKALTVVASRLRGLLAERGVDGSKVLTSAFGCYRLNLPEGAWVDVIVAVDAARQAEAALAADDLDQAKALATRAASLTRPAFLPGEVGAWVAAKRRELEDVRRRALQCLGEACLSSGDEDEAAKWAEEMIILEPYRETGYRLLMEAHAAVGNRAEALRVYERCRRLLAEELGAFPSPETESFYRVLLQAPSPAPEAAALAAREREQEVSAGQLRVVTRARALALVATALVVGAVVAVAAMFPSTPREAPPESMTLSGDAVAVIDPSSNTVVDEIRVGARPAGIAVGFDSVWVGNPQQQTLVRIDAETRRVVKTIGLPVEPSRIAIGADAVWIASRESKAVVRVDPTFNRVTDRIDVSGTDAAAGEEGLPGPEDVAVGGNAVWIAHGLDAVSRVSPKTNAVVRRIQVGSASGIVFGDGAAWSLSGLGQFHLTGGFDRIGVGVLSRIDPATKSVTLIRRLPEVGRVSPGPNGLAFGEGAIWVIKPDGTIFKVDAVTGRLESVVRLGESSLTAPTMQKFRPLDVAVGESAVWIANNGGTITRIDPETAHVVRTIPLGREPRIAYPVELAAGEGAVWVTMH